MNVDDHAMPSGQHYSATNRVPNIQEFMQRLDSEKRQRDAEIDAELRRNKRNPDVKIHRNELLEKKGTRKVRDPVTGKDVGIRDADMDFEEAVENPQMSVPNGNLGKHATIATSSQQSGEEYRYAQDVTAPPDPIQEGSTSDVPIRSEKTSVLFYKTPSVSYEPMFTALELRSNLLCAGIFMGIVFFGRLFGGRLLGLIPLAICVTSGVHLWVQDLIRKGRDLEWSSEQERGETATINLIPESVEWMNTAIGVFWGMINPEMFAGVADTIEDVMAASVPGVIEHVRVADISQGSNPIRILNMRALPDSHVQDIKDEIHKENEKTMDEDELAAVSQAGAFYNMEVSIGYHAKPSGADIASKARNMGMQLVFYLGIKGLFGVPLPIWVELIGLVCTARVRLQLSPEPPFLKTMTITLMGIPKVQAGCTPMLQRGVNILNLPLISNFVNWAIKATASMYVAPKSLTLDMSKMLQGDDIKKETEAFGVIFIRIHKATGLSKQDQRGSKGGGSDPYITISWSKFGKPQFCTRVIQDNLNPVFEETCGLLVTSDLIKADEQLSVELWDSDRSSADDEVGKIELSIQELIQHPGKMFQHVSTLSGLKPDTVMPGELHWEVGFFGKTQFRKALRTDGHNVNVVKELGDRPEFHDEWGTIQNEEEDAAVHTPPDPLWPSGILSVVVHQIVGLELANVKGSNGNRKGREYEPARPEAGEVKEEQGKKLPSSYCTILINDDLIYKTRTKVLGWDIGSFEFVSDTIVASGYAPASHVRLRLRTGGSTANVKRDHSVREGDSTVFNIGVPEGGKKLRLPVRFRYKSPVFIEFHPAGKRGPDAFAALWLLELVDNQEREFDIPLWKCNNPVRLSQNYITQENFASIPDLDIKEVGRVRFRGRFSAGTDMDHIRFVSDSDSRETIETWEACYAEGVRQQEVQPEVPELVQKLHDESLTQGRDVLAHADEKEKDRWLAKDGTDWTGAFGQDPQNLMNQHMSSADTEGHEHFEIDTDENDDDDDEDGDGAIGMRRTETDPTYGSAPSEGSEDRHSLESAGTNTSRKSNASTGSKNPIKAYKNYKEKSRDLHRKQRGLMQWLPMRNARFAKDEAKYAVRKVKKMGALNGRTPDVESEI
ncbi:hypothetical protein ACSS6W_010499 [Trichoderma asperelloides]